MKEIRLYWKEQRIVIRLNDEKKAQEFENSASKFGYGVSSKTILETDPDRRTKEERLRALNIYNQIMIFKTKIQDIGCLDGLLPNGEFCPRCGGRRAPSGIDGGTWVHLS